MKIFIKGLACLLGIVSVHFGQESRCPHITVEGSETPPRKGDVVYFQVKMGPPTIKPAPRFFWLISSGQILKGQHGPKIDVLYTDPNAGLTATVEVKGLPAACERYASASAPFFDPGPVMLVDEFPVASMDRLKDSLAASIKQDQDAQVFVLIQLDAKDSLGQVKKRIRAVRKTLPARDIKRIRFIVQQPGNGLSKVYLVPEGAEAPTCSASTICTHIK